MFNDNVAAPKFDIEAIFHVKSAEVSKERLYEDAASLGFEVKATYGYNSNSEIVAVEIKMTRENLPSLYKMYPMAQDSIMIWGK